MLRRFSFVKGHGTENDFVLLPDHDGEVFPDLDPATVRRLTDRPSGLGADGVIRIVRSEALPEGRDQASRAEWFMDYRNADGSVAEMCGNGIRVLARYLWSARLAPGPELPIGTRAGVRTVFEQADGLITVDMGAPTWAKIREPMTVTAGGRSWPIDAVFLPNPHAVAFVDDLDDPGRLLDAPRVLAGALFPHGANVEFVVVRGPRHVAMRVWERGVGETPSCGTGVCAAAFARMERDGPQPGSSYIVDVPGGTLTVSLGDDGSLLLTGPAVLGVSGTIELPPV